MAPPAQEVSHVYRWRLWPWVLAGLLLSGASLWAGRMLYVQDARRTPFLRAAEQVTGVQRIRASTSTVRVWLKPRAQLSQVYPRILSLAEQDLGARASVAVMNSSSPAEQTVNQQLAFLVAQAEARGDYAALPDVAHRLADRDHLRLTLVLGRRNLFITLMQGRHRLDAVYPLTWIGFEGGGGDA